MTFCCPKALLASGKNLKMNYGCLVSAFGADLGLSPAEFYAFMFPSFLGGMQPCYADALEKRPGEAFALAHGDVAYEGPPKRKWPAPRR